MAAPRVTLTDGDKQIKMADRALIKAAGGIEAVAVLAERSSSTVGEWQALDTARFMPQPVRLALEDATRGLAGHPHATAYAARRSGHVLVALPAGAPSSGDFHAALAKLVKETGDITTGLLTALSDLTVCRRDAAPLMPECVHVAEEVMRIHALLGEIVEAEG